MTALQVLGRRGRLAAWRSARCQFGTVSFDAVSFDAVGLAAARVGPVAGLVGICHRPAGQGRREILLAEAVEKANRVIGEIEHQFHRDLAIETFATVPADKVDQVKGMDAKAQGAVLSHVGARAAQSEQLNGIFVLITKEPKHIQAVVGDKTQHEGVHAARSRPAGRGIDQGLQAGSLRYGPARSRRFRAQNDGREPRHEDVVEPSGRASSPPRWLIMKPSITT